MSERSRLLALFHRMTLLTSAAVGVHCTVFGVGDLVGTGSVQAMDGSGGAVVIVQDASSLLLDAGSTSVPPDAALSLDAKSLTWLAPDCDKRRVLTLGLAAQGAQALTDFPAVVDLTGFGARLPSTQSIVFTDADGTTILPHERRYALAPVRLCMQFDKVAGKFCCLEWRVRRHLASGRVECAIH
jgi:hypothetical protein